MSNLPWCDSKIEGDFLKVHDLCLNPNCKRRKQITFTPNQFHLEEPDFEKQGKNF